MNSIRPIIEALEGAHAHFNTALFGGRLRTRPVITVQTRGRKSAYGWYWPQRWQNGTSNPAELNISAEELKRDPADVLLTMAHEMVHQVADETGVKDTSRGGRYHNKAFAKLAEAAGLCAPAAPDKRLGFSGVTWGPEGSRGRAAFDSLDATIRAGFDLARTLPNVKKQKSKMLLFTCGCGFKIRCGRRELAAQCLACDGEFTLQDGGTGA